MVLFEIHQRFKGHLLNKLRVSFNMCSDLLLEPLAKCVVEDFLKAAVLKTLQYLQKNILDGVNEVTACRVTNYNGVIVMI